MELLTDTIKSLKLEIEGMEVRNNAERNEEVEKLKLDVEEIVLQINAKKTDEIKNLQSEIDFLKLQKQQEKKLGNEILGEEMVKVTDSVASHSKPTVLLQHPTVSFKKKLFKLSAEVGDDLPPLGSSPTSITRKLNRRESNELYRGSAMDNVLFLPGEADRNSPIVGQNGKSSTIINNVNAATAPITSKATWKEIMKIYW